MSKLVLTVTVVCYSVRQGVPGAQEGRRGRQQTVRHEGAEEGDHRAEEEDDGTHQDRTAGVGGCQTVALPRHSALRLPD